MQIVFLTIRPDILNETIVYVENLMKFINEVIIVTPDDISKKIHSKLKTKIIHDQELLAKDYAFFKKSDHVMKNWLLRTALADSEIIENEFIMADDDNRPMVNIPISFFKKNNTLYNCYISYTYIVFSCLVGIRPNRHYLLQSSRKLSNSFRISFFKIDVLLSIDTLILLKCKNHILWA